MTKNFLVFQAIFFAASLLFSCSDGTEQDNETDPISDPIVSPPGGEYDHAVDITITCETPNTEAFYSIDGADPDVRGVPYTGELRFYERVTIKAICSAIGASDVSNTIENIYTFQYIEPDAITLEEVDLMQTDNWLNFSIVEGEDIWFLLNRSAETISVQLLFDHAEGDINVELLDVFGGVLESSTTATDGESIETYYDEAGIMYLRVSLISGGSSDFDIRWDDF